MAELTIQQKPQVAPSSEFDFPLDNSDRIYRTLKEEILNLVIPPGTAISESDICGRFSVSRTPARGALRHLAAVKLIRIVPYRETTVSLINLHQIKQMIYMRTAIESRVLRDFMEIQDRFMLEKIRYFLGRQAALLDTDFTPRDFFAEDSAFHRIWFTATDKDFLWRKIQAAQVHYTRFRMLDIVGAGNFSGIEKEHEQLFSIIKKKDTDAVEPFITRHLNGGIKRLGKRIYTDFAAYFEDKDLEGTK
ncbi:GntR family transcriptional regulator [Spirochaetia bacterium]|nr:GntR family transcriptional regulator [Spirochaetia bacterium]